MLVTSRCQSVDRLLHVAIEVIVPCLKFGLTGGRQLNLVDRCAWGNYIVHSNRTVRARVRLSQFTELLQMNHQTSRSNGGALISLVYQPRCASSRMMFPEKQVGFVSQERRSIFEYPVFDLTYVLEISKKSHNGCPSGMM